LVIGQPSENVIALFGYEFYEALASIEPEKAINLYKSYLSTGGIDPAVAERKVALFRKYADGEASPEVMTNYGDNDPEWSKAFNKLTLLLEFHPSALLFDEGTLNPLESSGVIHGNPGHVAGPMDSFGTAKKTAIGAKSVSAVFPDSNKFA
jgi:hypothetical protein